MGGAVRVELYHKIPCGNMTWKWGQSFTYTRIAYDDILSDMSESFVPSIFISLVSFCFSKFVLTWLE